MLEKQGSGGVNRRLEAPVFARNLNPVLALLGQGIKLHHIRLQLL